MDPPDQFDNQPATLLDQSPVSCVIDPFGTQDEGAVPRGRGPGEAFDKDMMAELQDKMAALSTDARSRDIKTSNSRVNKKTNVFKRRHSIEDPTEYYVSGENRTLVTRFGLPESGYLFQDENYVLCYDRSRRVPFWVARLLKRKHLEGTVGRKNSPFHRDPEVHEQFQTNTSDYDGAAERFNLSRGHLVPARDAKFDKQAHYRTFSLVQIFPQDEHLNKGLWLDLEEKCDTLVKAYGSVVVVGVTIFLPQERRRPCSGLPEEDPEYWQNNMVLGSIHGVHVPTHCAMIILVLDNEPDETDNMPSTVTELYGDTEDSDSDDLPKIKAVGAYQFPNCRIQSKYNYLSRYKVTVEHIEKNAGLEFFFKLKDLDIDSIQHADTLPEWNECKNQSIGRRSGRKFTRMAGVADQSTSSVSGPNNVSPK